ncbi:MAG: hypothetical protein ACR2PL_27735 [Dehalococcoidia bacterium]
MNAAQLLASYFCDHVDADDLPPYFTFGVRRPKVAVAALDSSDQTVLAFDEVTGVAACRTGLNIMRRDQEITYRLIGEIIYVAANPSAPIEDQLRAKLNLDQALRFATGCRPSYSSLRSGPPILPPRLLAAGVRVAEDHRTILTFADSGYAVPGMLLMADGRLNAQHFPPPLLVDRRARLLRARGIHYVRLAKGGKLISVVRRVARTIRKRVADMHTPFAFPILKRHLLQAYRDNQISAKPKTILHGSSSDALGGVGAVRFGLSLSGDHLAILEMSVYDFEAFGGLVKTGEPLKNYISRLRGERISDVYPWHVLQYVSACDFERQIIPTLEEIAYTADTDTELGIYPRALADIHNHIKLRFDDVDLERKRREICNELARAGVPYELIPIAPEVSHKTDPEEYNLGLTWF